MGAELKKQEKQGNTGVRGPWRKQHFQLQRFIDFSTLALFCEHGFVQNGHEMPYEAVRRNPVSMVFAGDSARHHFQNYIFSDKIYFHPHSCNAVAKSLNKSFSILLLRKTY